MAQHEIREETLPYEEVPLDLMCPVCGSGPYKTENGLRGHAYGAHKLKWGTKPKPPSQKLTPAWRSTLKDTTDLVEIKDLKPWHKVALLQHHVLGTPWAKIAVVLGRSTAHMGEISTSPAAVKFRAELDELLTNTPALVRMAIQTGSLGIAMDDATALEWAKDAKDYNFIHKFAQDYFKIAGVIEPAAEKVQQAIHLHLSTDQLTIPDVPSSHTEIVVENADFDVEDKDG